MMSAAPSASLNEIDAQLFAAQEAWLDKLAPGHRTRRIRWSAGTTQLIEVVPTLAEEGPPILLIHGGLGEAFQWAPIMQSLAQKRRVLAVDRPGHGLADPFDSRGVDLMAHARQFVGDILDAADATSAAIVGSSMGGLFATAFALAQPKRVAQLVLLSPAGVTRALPLMLRMGTLPVLRGLVRGMMRKPTRASMRSFWKQLLVAHSERLSDEFLDLSALSQARNATSWFALIDRAFDIRGLRSDLLSAARFGDLRVPTTFIWGEKDAFAPPRCAEPFIAQNPALRLVTISDAGHAPWFDEPTAIVQAISAALAREPDPIQ